MMDILDMVISKADPEIAKIYEDNLADKKLIRVGKKLRFQFEALKTLNKKITPTEILRQKPQPNRPDIIDFPFVNRYEVINNTGKTTLTTRLSKEDTIMPNILKNIVPYNHTLSNSNIIIYKQPTTEQVVFESIESINKSAETGLSGLMNDADRGY